MKTIFSPVIRILNLLSYIRKFILIGIILILPLAITLYLFVNELNSEVRFTQKELYGLEYNIALRGAYAACAGAPWALKRLPER